MRPEPLGLAEIELCKRRGTNAAAGYSVPMRRPRLTALSVCLGLLIVAIACSRNEGASASSETMPKQSSQEPHTQAAPSTVVVESTPSKPGDLSGSPEQSEQLAKYALDELPALRAGQTLGEWKKRHADATVEPYAPTLSEQSNSDWCARGRLDASLDGDRKVRRAAYFYLPDPPTPLALPVDVPCDQLLNQCRLGFVWAEIEDPDAGRAEHLADSTRESVASILGVGELNAKLSWWGAGYWRKAALWKDQALSVATASTSFRAWPSGGPGTSTRVFVTAAGKLSNIRFERLARRTDTPEEYVEAFRVIESRMAEAITIAGIGGDGEASVRSALKVLSKYSPPWHFPRDADSTLILEAIDGWLGVAPTSPPLRRAAALFVADQLLGHSGTGWGKDQYPPIRRRLEAHGAKFNWAQLGDTWVYAHSWLKEALQLDPDGRSGDLAFITLMESGFETSGTCSDQGGNGFRAVLKEGAGFLRRKPDSDLQRDIHLLMAEAYGDIVTLANGGGYDQSVSAEFQPEAAGSRIKAIEEYRAAFAPTPPLVSRTRETWRDAWRLMAGLTPSRTHFYCVYD
jgi:hypothetical protein